MLINLKFFFKQWPFTVFEVLPSYGLAGNVCVRRGVPGKGSLLDTIKVMKIRRKTYSTGRRLTAGMH